MKAKLLAKMKKMQFAGTFVLSNMTVSQVSTCVFDGWLHTFFHERVMSDSYICNTFYV